MSPIKCSQVVQARDSPDLKSQTPSVPPPTSSQSSQPQQPSQTSSQSHSVATNSPVDHADANGSALAAVRLPVASQSHLYIESNALKLRKALQHKESQQQQSSPQQGSQLPQASTSAAPSRIVGPQRPSSPREKSGLQNWPFDYVKNKIVEEMHRTSDDDGAKSNAGSAAKSSGTLSSEEGISSGSNSGSGGGGNGGSNEQQPTSQPYLAATNYPYPYSALNINSQVPVSSHTAPTITPKPVVDVLEPTPILSAQYEPLSDED